MSKVAIRAEITPTGFGCLKCQRLIWEGVGQIKLTIDGTNYMLAADQDEKCPHCGDEKIGKTPYHFETSDQVVAKARELVAAFEGGTAGNIRVVGYGVISSATHH